MNRNADPPLAPSDAAAHAAPKLLRALGPGTAIALVVGNVIGSGIFAKPGAIAGYAGDFRLIIAAWVTGGVLCLLGALCFAELAAMLPHAGGLYVYLREAYGRPVAFLFGWCEFLFLRPASIGALAVIFVGSMSKAMTWNFDAVTSVVLTSLVVAAVAWVNILGVIWGGHVQNVTTVVKAGFLGLLAVGPFLLLLLGRSGFDLANYATTLAPSRPTTGAQFGAVLLAVMWAYNGWHQITPVAEEIREPHRNIPLAMFLGIGLLILLYVGANFAYHGVLSMQQITAAGDHAAEEMVRVLLGPVGGTLMSAVVMCSVFGAINSNLLHGPRVSFAMGRDKVFPGIFGQVHANFRTPAVAIVVQAMMAILLVVASAVLVAWTAYFKNRSIFDMLTDYTIFSSSIFYMLAVLAVLVLRRKHPDWQRPYRTWGYPLVPALFVAVYIWFLWQVYLDRPYESQTGLALIALGLPVYFGWQYFFGTRRNAQQVDR